MAQNYVLLERIELNASAASVTFSSIPQTGYTDLKIVFSTRDTNASANNGDVRMYFNGTSGTTNYSYKWLYGTGSAANSLSYTSQSGISAGLTSMDSAGNTANTFSNGEIYIPNYTSSSAKSVSSDAAGETNATAAYMGMTAGLWNQTAAITSITLTPTTAFAQYSTFSLYGIAAVGTTPAIAPKADGGNVIATDGTYWYHAFLSNGTFTPSLALSCDYLIVAGGGAGGSGYYGAGGGAGGVRAFATQSLTATGYAVTVGAGGSPGASQQIGGSGTSTTFNSTSVSGGAGGGGYAASTGANGGSGGGGAGAGGSSTAGAFGGSGNTGSYSPVEGYAGGRGWNGPAAGGGGGGGGLSGTGGNAGYLVGGTGAAGAAAYNSINFSTWLTATNTGSATKVAAGGGGGTYNGGTLGTGGSGGGGNGSLPTNNGSAAVANTGSGGGGAGDTGNFGGAGGSGIVIIRYAV